jgi:hypothetical protein
LGVIYIMLFLLIFLTGFLGVLPGISYTLVFFHRVFQSFKTMPLNKQRHLRIQLIKGGVLELDNLVIN